MTTPDGRIEAELGRRLASEPTMSEVCRSRLEAFRTMDPARVQEIPEAAASVAARRLDTASVSPGTIRTNHHPDLQPGEAHGLFERGVAVRDDLLVEPGMRGRMDRGV